MTIYVINIWLASLWKFPIRLKFLLKDAQVNPQQNTLKYPMGVGNSNIGINYFFEVVVLS